MPQPAGRLKPGDPAPVLDVQSPDGAISLAAVWADAPVVLTFLRHFG